jgi:hypothetical protein
MSVFVHVNIYKDELFRSKLPEDIIQTAHVNISFQQKGKVIG